MAGQGFKTGLPQPAKHQEPASLHGNIFDCPTTCVRIVSVETLIGYPAECIRSHYERGARKLARFLLERRRSSQPNGSARIESGQATLDFDEVQGWFLDVQNRHFQLDRFAK